MPSAGQSLGQQGCWGLTFSMNGSSSATGAMCMMQAGSKQQRFCWLLESLYERQQQQAMMAIKQTSTRTMAMTMMAIPMPLMECPATLMQGSAAL